MAGHGNGGGHGNAGNHGNGGDHGNMGHGDDDGPMGVPRDEPGSMGHGRSEDSPGHLKRAAGDQSARDYAPGRLGDGDGDASDNEGMADRNPGA